MHKTGSSDRKENDANMDRLTRREFLAASAMAGLATAGPLAALGANATQTPTVTCFYQFGRGALDALKDALPNGTKYLHIFSHSHPGMNAHADTARMVRACGESFKYTLAFDVNKYKGWQMASDDELKQWAMEFREKALVADGPADYFAFNEMPTTGAMSPPLRERVTKWLRYLHEAGGGPKLRGVFYFTERNLNPTNWSDSGDDFWAALDETCDLVVGEHYHSYDFCMNQSKERLAAHLFPLSKWLKDSGKPAQMNIAERKYTVLHSSYYGPMVTGWAGVQNDKRDEAELEKYFQHLVAATRQSEFGKKRIGFGPLATRNFDVKVLPVLARVLREESKD